MKIASGGFLGYVQDADRIDAMGAVGIGRTFTFGGSRNRAMYGTNSLKMEAISQQDKNQKNTDTLAHFYEKLFTLKDRIKTEEGKGMGEGRHSFIIFISI